MPNPNATATPWDRHFDIADLVMSSTAYYCGRSTYAVSTFSEALIAAWPDLPRHVKRYVERIVEECFHLDRVGHQCDRESWEQVRKLWGQSSRTC